MKLSEATPSLIKAVQFILKHVELYDGAINGICNKETFYAFNEFKEKEYLGYADVLGKSTASALLEALERPAPNDSEVVEVSPRQQIYIFRVGIVHPNQPIIPDGNFTWGEATKGLTRIPSSLSEIENIIKAAKTMEEVRNFLGGNPITVTSWLRPLLVNRAVGGASNSRHIYGDGLDFKVAGMHPQQVFQRLSPWYGKRGGLASSNTFTHIDGRSYAARWKYN